MDEGQIARSALQDEVLRGQEMKTPDDVAAMLLLKACGWVSSGSRGSWAAAITR